ncbi:flagellar basal-body rod protein FlgF [Chitinispirillales bacterium ANBcel5]|uniref:flagellar basal-body rod protein FlgF n=1 Tax=Cellulosispirillum alkaliphilum TaxID=3039283 RepID=UPI002A525F25|nr:flagellar basal-body rod protein FlgF [Chitinispirillales bacterium ANBcel5]
MIQGIYTASQSMTLRSKKQDQIANNLANMNTTGYKQSGLFSVAVQKYLTNDNDQDFANRDIKADEVYVDHREGVYEQSKSPLDLSIKGDGFFKVMTPDGVRYTRNGNFSLNPDGLIVTSDGSKLMGTEGYIRVERNIPVQITESGEVIQESESKGIINVVDFPKPYQFVRGGNSYFRPQMPGAVELKPSHFSVQQGYLEKSNVDVIRNMVEMIAAHRNFEADQKALHAQDETLDRAVNQVGRVG